MTVRNMTEEDLVRVQKIDSNSFPNRKGPAPQYQRYISEPNRIAFVIHDKKKGTIGYVALTERPAGKQEIHDGIRIDYIAVDKDERRHGHGSRLIGKIKKYAKEKDEISCVYLHVRAQQRIVRKCYEKNGFEKTDKLLPDFINGDKKIEMTWSK